MNPKHFSKSLKPTPRTHVPTCPRTQTVGKPMETSEHAPTTTAQTDINGQTGPAPHYPLQHYSATRKQNTGQNSLDIRKGQNNPSPNLIY